MRTILKAAIATAIITAALPASASQSPYGTVYGFQAGGGGVVRFNVTGGRSSAPGCSNPSFPNRWALDASTAAGQAQLSIVLTAYALHKPLLVVGTGDCSLTGDTELVAGFATDNI